jgi:hypothetical protein
MDEKDHHSLPHLRYRRHFLHGSKSAQALGKCHGAHGCLLALDIGINAVQEYMAGITEIVKAWHHATLFSLISSYRNPIFFVHLKSNINVPGQELDVLSLSKWVFSTEGI